MDAFCPKCEHYSLVIRGKHIVCFREDCKYHHAIVWIEYGKPPQ